MDYRKAEDKIYIRFDKGDEIISGINEICKREKIVSATYFGIGCCFSAVIFSRFPNEHGYEDRKHTKQDTLELEQIIGTISLSEENKIVHHAHAAFTYMDQQAQQHIFAGHLLSAHVLYTVEITMLIAPMVIGQMTDPATGIKVIKLN